MSSQEAREERWSSTVVLGNGETALVRPIRPSDAGSLAAFHERQSPESIYRRFFSPKPRLTDADLQHFTVVDFVDRAALVVERYGEFIAWASYERWPGRDDADAAFQVDDAHHGKGIATLLLEHLAAVARSNGIVRFTAEVLADNRPMLAVFARAGWPVERRFESGVVDLDFSLDATEEFLDSVERREQRADSRAMARLLLPRTIAVVGASDEPGSIGDALWRHVTAAATGAVFPVNPRHEEVGGSGRGRALQDVPGDVNLAVVAVPAPALPTVVEDCIEARVRGAVVITSIEGTDIDFVPLVARARRFGVRLIGPGSMGVAAPHESVGVRAILVPDDLRPGSVAVSLQSGSIGASLLRLAEDMHMGLSWFVSLGDKCDVSGNDLLQFWEDDEATNVIAMYTESFGNPRKFARIARRVSRRRPIVAVRTGAAAIGASGGALYQQAGLIEVPTVAALLDTARVLATQPVMRGPRVALLTNARSPATLSQAALHTAGLEAVDSAVPLDWRSTPDDYGAALRAALDDDDVHGVLIVHAPPLAAAVAAPSTPSSWQPPARRSRSSRSSWAGATGPSATARRCPRSPSPSRPPVSSAGRGCTARGSLTRRTLRSARSVTSTGRRLAPSSPPPSPGVPTRSTWRRSSASSARTGWSLRRRGAGRRPKRSRWPTTSGTRSLSRPSTGTSVDRCGRASPSTWPAPTTSPMRCGRCRKPSGPTPTSSSCSRWSRPVWTCASAARSTSVSARSSRSASAARRPTS